MSKYTIEFINGDTFIAAFRNPMSAVAMADSLASIYGFKLACIHDEPIESPDHDQFNQQLQLDLRP